MVIHSNHHGGKSKTVSAKSGLAFHADDPFYNYRIQATRLTIFRCRGHADLVQICICLFEIANDVTGEVRATDSHLAKLSGIGSAAVADRVRKLSKINFPFTVERGCGTRKTRYTLTADACRLIRDEKVTRILRNALREGEVDLALPELGHNPSSTGGTTPRLHALPYREKEKRKQAVAQKAPAKASVCGRIEFAYRVKSKHSYLLKQLEDLLTEFGFNPGHAIREKLIPPGDHFFSPATVPSSAEAKGQLFKALRSDTFMSLEFCFEKATFLTVEN